MTIQRRVLPFPLGASASVMTVLAVLWAGAGVAEAKRLGPTQIQCRSCHDSGKATTVTVTPSTMTPAISSVTKLTVAITAAAGDTVGGMFIEIQGDGMLRTVSGQGTRMEEAAITHAVPKAVAGGKITFEVEYVAPAKQGRVDISVGGVSANDNQKEHDDSVGSAFLSLAIGCGTGNMYYIDDDADGYGDAMGRFTRACAKPAGYSDKTGDCNDANLEISPAAKETCNQLDDDCNGMTDEGLPVVTLFKDGDGDGYGKAGTEMMMGCGVRFGWGVGDGDCNDMNRDVHPMAMELCNNIDDNCTGGVDEGALPVCGVGFCRRYGVSCDRPEDCRPGKPSAEKCDLQDNDCDGETDESVTDCKANEICKDARCVPDTGARGGSSAEGGGAGSASAGSSGAGGSRRGSGGGCIYAAHPVSSNAAVTIFILGSVGLFFRSRNRRRHTRGA